MKRKKSERHRQKETIYRQSFFHDLGVPIQWMSFPRKRPSGWYLKKDPQQPEGERKDSSANDEEEQERGELQPNRDDQKRSEEPKQGPAPLTPEEKARKIKEIVTALGDDEYEVRRNDLAREYAVRTSYLDALRPKRRTRDVTEMDFEDPEPWPEEVDGAELLDELAAVQRRYMVLPEGGAEVGALWVLFAWSHDEAQVSPIFVIVGPNKRCGKSSYVSLLTRLLPRVLPVSNATGASIFRAIEAHRPTILLDELETYLKRNELRGILDSSHLKTQAFVLRANGRYSTWAPKVFALIGSLPPTLTDRSIVVKLKRRLKSEQVDRLVLSRMEKHAAELRRKAYTWARVNEKLLREAEPEVPPMNDRAADNWRELIKRADVAGGRWPALSRKIARAFAAMGADDEDMAAALLFDIKAIFDERGSGRIRSWDFQKALAAMADRAWADYGGRAITSRRIADMLRPYDIRPKRSGMYNYYSKEDFVDAWRRYKLPNFQGDQEAEQAGQTEGQVPPSKKIKRYELDAGEYLRKKRDAFAQARQKAIEDKAGKREMHPQ